MNSAPDRSTGAFIAGCGRVRGLIGRRGLFGGALGALVLRLTGARATARPVFSVPGAFTVPPGVRIVSVRVLGSGGGGGFNITEPGRVA